ncbi:MAG TPA: alpha/beta fold hydrolase [Geminicoccaceae bacterium]|nr:alpha/beta fold hydrolase [Geminicoccaceae bacterium]
MSGIVERVREPEAEREWATAPARRRLGPRPLPLYLAAAAALDAVDGPSDPPGPGPSERFLAGLRAYWRHPYRRALEDPPAIWARGSTRLLDFGPEPGFPVLLVPSLVNRGYILDLSPERSLARELARRGLRPLLVDWQEPGAAELGLSLDDYIGDLLEEILTVARRATRRRPVVLGYCMGGLLALPLAERRRREVAGLALLATPWDFSLTVAAAQLAPLVEAGLALGAIGLAGQVPVGVLEALFAAGDPRQVVEKFADFGRLPQAGARAEAFVAIEDWLGDGVPLAGAVARTCLVEWYTENRPHRGEWRVAGAPVAPAELDLPALVVAPRRDRIVPEASALPLATLLPRAELLRPAAGHVGMVAGRHAPEQLWRPLAAWLRRIAAMQD